MVLEVMRGTSHYSATLSKMFPMPVDQSGLLDNWTARLTLMLNGRSWLNIQIILLGYDNTFI